MLASCEVYDYNLYDKNYNPFFRTQWSVIDENGTMVPNNHIIIFDFDYYDANSLSFYTPKHFTSQSYKTHRVSEETWVIDNYYYNDVYCKIVIHIVDYLENPRYANLTIYSPDNFIIAKYAIWRNNNIQDINSLL
jgi:hypothetical protein